MSRVLKHRPGECRDLKRDQMLRSISEDAPSKLGLFRSVYARKSAPRAAIKAQCLACCWFDQDAIRECTATSCPLWDFRPFSRPAKDQRGDA